MLKSWAPIRATLIVSCLFVLTLVLVQNSGPDLAYAEANAAGQAPVEQDYGPGSLEEGTLANCRYGIIAGWDTVFILPLTGAGVFYHYSSPYSDDPLPLENNAEFFRMIRTRQEKTPQGDYLPNYNTSTALNERLAQLIRDNPGYVWMLGNEIERGPNPGETYSARTDDIHADIYAEAYHDIYHFIKGNDPTARIANAGLIQITPMRLQYLDLVWDAYLSKYGKPMPVDVWTVHNYVLPELNPDGTPSIGASVALGTDPALGKRWSGNDITLCPDDDVYCYAEHDSIEILEEQMVSMRRWMKEHGQQNKPLVVTEYGTLYPYVRAKDGEPCYLRDEFGSCFEPERVIDFMRKSFELFTNARDLELGYPQDDYKLMQQWIWFMSKGPNTMSGNLMINDGSRLNEIGEAFKDHVQNEATYMNLRIEEVSSDVIAVREDGTATAQLSVSFRNNGNVAVETPFNVTFYRDAALTQPIGAKTISPLVRGCATKSYSATVEWDDLETGTHPFWVFVDNGQIVPEFPPSNADNIGSGQVVVDGDIPVHTLEVEIVSHGDGQGGTVDIFPAKATYQDGTEITLTAVPFAGWTFTGWQGESSVMSHEISITIAKDTTLEAHFTQEQYELLIDQSGEGEVTIDPEQDYYVYGEKVTLTAEAAEDWSFIGWSGDFKTAEQSIQLTFTGDFALKAAFLKIIDHVYLPISVNPN